jgi:hypothetical protein
MFLMILAYDLIVMLFNYQASKFRILCNYNIKKRF